MGEKKINGELLLKSGVWYTVSNYLTRAMLFISMPIFTRLMTNSEFGDFSIFANWQAVLLIICGLENYSTINRARFDFQGKGKFDSYISSALLLSTIFTGCVFFLYCLLPNLFDKIFLLDRKYIWVMFAYLFTYPAFAMFQAKQRIEYKYKLSTAIALFLSFFSVGLSVALVIGMTDDRLLGRILGQYAPYITIGIFFYIYFLRRSHKFTMSAWKYALRMGLPMVFGFLGSQVLLSSDSFVVKQLCSGEAVSYLSITHSCSHIILLLVQTLNGAWAPWFYDMLRLNNITKIRKTYLVYLWCIVISTIVASLIGPEIIHILGGKSYMEATAILPAYILGGVFTVLTAHLSSLEAYYRRPEYSAIFTMIAAALNVVFDIIGVKLIGYRAVCYATVLCQLILIALHYFATIKMGVQELLPFRNMMLPLMISLAIIPVSLVLYQYAIARFCVMIGLFFLLVIACWTQHKRLYRLFYKLKT